MDVVEISPANKRSPDPSLKKKLICAVSFLAYPIPITFVYFPSLISEISDAWADTVIVTPTDVPLVFCTNSRTLEALLTNWAFTHYMQTKILL